MRKAVWPPSRWSSTAATTPSFKPELAESGQELADEIYAPVKLYFEHVGKPPLLLMSTPTTASPPA
jgi:hypothetical protein